MYEYSPSQRNIDAAIEQAQQSIRSIGRARWPSEAFSPMLFMPFMPLDEFSQFHSRRHAVKQGEERYCNAVRSIAEDPNDLFGLPCLGEMHQNDTDIKGL